MPENLTRRGHQFVFRRSVPEPIRSILGKREVKVALGSDYRAACREAAILTVQTNEQFDAARVQLSSTATVDEEYEKYRATPPDKRKRIKITQVTSELKQQIESLVLSGLETDLKQRRDGLSDDAFDHLGNVVRTIKPTIDRGLATGQVDYYRGLLFWLLKARGYELDVPEATIRELTYEYVKVLQKHFGVLEARQKGNLVVPELASEPLPAIWELPKKPTQPAHEGPTWEELLARWESDRDRQDTNTVSEIRPIWKSLVDFAGQTPPVRFSKAMVTDWLKALRDKRGNHPKTLEKKGSLVGAVFSLAVKDEVLSTNPFAGYSYKRFAAKIGTVSETKRYPFTIDELSTLFHPKTGLASLRSHGGGGRPAREWMPLIALFAGARLDEIGQLRKADFVVGPVPHFKIQRAKNSASIRDIPIHPKLIELGLLDYIASCKSDHVFPGLYQRGEDVPNSEVLGRWFNRQVKENLLPGGQGKVFHSFRHTFKDLCRNAGIPKDLHQALTGHSSSDVGDNYGIGFSLEVKASELAKIQLPIEFYQPAHVNY